MENAALLDVFRELKEKYLAGDTSDFRNALSADNSILHLWPVVQGTELERFWQSIHNDVEAIRNTSLPDSLALAKYTHLKDTVAQIIELLETGKINTPVLRIPVEIIGAVTDSKIKKICHEINSTPGENTISLLQSVGEAIKWTLAFQCKQKGVDLKKWSGELKPILDIAVESKIFSDTITKKLVVPFRDNFIKQFYDMLRHDPEYIPAIEVINPSLEALPRLLSETFN